MRRLRAFRNLVLVLAAFSFFLACGPRKEDLPQLIRQLSSSASHDRNSAALAIGSLGPEAASAVPALVRLLNDSNGGVRSSAAYALRSIGTPEALKALQ